MGAVFGKGVKVKRNTLNYWVDVGIGCAFVLSAISGLVFLLPVESFDSQVLGLGYPIWNALHTWSSLALIGGVLIHLVLHWKWIACMTGKILRPVREPQEGSVLVPGSVTRRRFLSLGLAAAATGVIAAGCALLARTRHTDTEQGSPTPDPGTVEPASAGEPEQSVQQPGGVACPRGIVDDPYPGRCRHYTDRNGDGICDYSVPGSGN